MTKSYQAVIWDYDGVIVDSHEFNKYACIAAAKQCGISVSDDEYTRHFYHGVSLRQGATNLLTHFGKLPQLENYINAKIAMDPEYHERVRIYPHVISTIHQLSAQHITQAICSGARKALLEEFIARHNLGSCIQTIVSAEDVATPKPSPEGYLLTIQKIGIPAHECLIVEDAISGIQAARQARADVIAITNTESAVTLTREHPTHIANGADEIIQFMRTSREKI